MNKIHRLRKWFKGDGVGKVCDACLYAFGLTFILKWGWWETLLLVWMMSWSLWWAVRMPQAISPLKHRLESMGPKNREAIGMVSLCLVAVPQLNCLVEQGFVFRWAFALVIAWNAAAYLFLRWEEFGEALKS